MEGPLCVCSRSQKRKGRKLPNDEHRYFLTLYRQIDILGGDEGEVHHEENAASTGGQTDEESSGGTDDDESSSCAVIEPTPKDRHQHHYRFTFW